MSPDAPSWRSHKDKQISTSNRARSLRRGARAVVGTVLGYLVINAAVYHAQTWLVLPGRRSQGWTSARVTPPPGAELVRFNTRKGEAVTALYAPALTPEGEALHDAERRPTMLYFYGTGSWLKTVLPEIEAFRRLGINVLAPEYVGYGMSTGSACEANCYATADAAYAYLKRERGIGAEQVIIAGTSLGGAVAIDLASRETSAGLVTFCTFTSMEEMARRQYGFLPVSLLLHQRFASQDKVADIRCPILMFHGQKDPFIPYSMMSRLAARATAPVTQVPVPQANHDRFFTSGGYDRLSELSRFVERLPHRSG